MSDITSDNELHLRHTPPLPDTLPNHSSANRPQHTITFKHPGYRDSNIPNNPGFNDLLTLFACDHPEGGLHYGTAFLACAIIAGNAWNGYFQESRDGTRVTANWDHLLRGKVYYFYVPGYHRDDSDSSQEAAHKYPVFPSFHHWSFPHGTIPSDWPTPPSQLDTGNAASNQADYRGLPAASGLTTYIIGRDRYCLLTRYEDYVERAHLCPRGEVEWFRSNSMDSYNDNKKLSGDWIVDDRSNAVLLRQDLHSSFDDRNFVLVRKQSKWVAHFLAWTKDQGPRYHNMPVSLHSSVSPSFLLARFAWAIFPLVENFLDRGIPRKLRLRMVGDNGFDEETKVVRGADLQNVSHPERQCKTSSRKRPNPESAEAENDEEYHHSKHRRLSSSRATPSDDACSLSSNTSKRSLQPPKSPPTSIDTAEKDIWKLERKMLKAQRPKDARLLCCDYNMAENNSRLGVPGARKLGGAYLCLECLGSEYRADEELPQLTPEDFE